MYVHKGLSEILFDDVVEHLVEHAAHLRRNFHIQMAFYVPLGEKLAFTAQQLFGVIGQHTRFAVLLEFDKCGGGIVHQSGGIVFRENIEISLSSQI